MNGYLSSTYSLLRLWIQILNVLIPINVCSCIYTGAVFILTDYASKFVWTNELLKYFVLTDSLSACPRLYTDELSRTIFSLPNFVQTDHPSIVAINRASGSEALCLSSAVIQLRVYKQCEERIHMELLM